MPEADAPTRVERILDDARRASELSKAGGRLRRHAHVMALGLAEPPPRSPLAAGFLLEPLDRSRVAEYGVVMGLAYPPGHPDHEPADLDPVVAAATFTGYLDGAEVGPWVAEGSLHVTDPSGRVVGAIVINESAGDAAIDAGPLVTDVFVDPDLRGIGLGAALVAGSATRLAEHGHSVLSLVVTAGNPAQRVYERLGFRITHETWRIDIPADDESS
jgi:GNAT superfamily N-acetyltransferase